MSQKKKHHHLPQEIYKLPGVFFLTICSRDRAETFGTFIDCNVELTALGRLISERWQTIPTFHPGTELFEFVVMPNHFHGLVSTLPAAWQCSGSIPVPSLPSIVNGFKAAVTRHGRLNGLIGSESPWQDDYWDHVIRDEQGLHRIREYILQNPLAWALDKENRRCSHPNEFYGWLEEQKLKYY